MNLKQKNYLVLTILALLTLVGSSCGKGTPALCKAIQMAATAGSEVGVKDPNFGSDALAQGFKVPSKVTIDTVQLDLSVIGNLGNAETITLNIVANNNGVPDTAVLSAGSFPIRNIISSNPQFYSVSVSSIQLLPATQYWLVLTASYPVSSTDQVRWSTSNTAVDVYTDGFAMSKVGAGWSQTALGATRDFVFKIGTCTTAVAN